VIDPTLTYGDYIGGAKDDSATRVAVDSSGNIYVVGSTKSTSIPNTSGTAHAAAQSWIRDSARATSICWPPTLRPPGHA